MAFVDNPLADFLRARRESLQPEDVGLPRGTGRRVPGLRREEIADRAGISVDYYLRLEQGRDRQPSEQVVRALSRALKLSPDASIYLHRIANPAPPAPPADLADVNDSIAQLLRRWSHTPAYVTDRNLDVLASNAAARALAPAYYTPGANLLLAAFNDSTDPFAQPEMSVTINRVVSGLRFYSDPADPRLHEILGELSVRSRPFRRLWARHEVQQYPNGSADYNIAPYGWVTLRWQLLAIPQTPGHFLTTFFADADSPGERALDHLIAEASAAVSA